MQIKGLQHDTFLRDHMPAASFRSLAAGRWLAALRLGVEPGFSVCRNLPWCEIRNEHLSRDNH